MASHTTSELQQAAKVLAHSAREVGLDPATLGSRAGLNPRLARVA
jgi:hypothetical protein